MTCDKRYAESTCKMIKQKYPNEPLIVYNHFSDWSVRFSSENSPIRKAEIMMGADAHAYKIYDVSGDALAFNTCIHAGRGHVFEIRVFKECFVLLALQNGKCLMGKMDVNEWRKVWVKPFGKKPYPVLDWDEMGRIAPEIIPPAPNKGFNRERAFFNGFLRSRPKEMPSMGEFEKALNSSDPETRVVALMSLGYSKDGDKALKLLREHLPKQKDLGIQKRSIQALVSANPGLRCRC